MAGLVRGLQKQLENTLQLHAKTATRIQSEIVAPLKTDCRYGESDLRGVRARHLFSCSFLGS